MTRRLLNLFTVLSLLAFVAVLGTWLRSYAPRDFKLGADHGNLLLLFTDGQWTSYARGTENFTLSYGDLWKMAQGQASGHGTFLGLSYVSRPTQTLPGAMGGTPGRFLLVAVPCAYPAALAAAAAAWAIVARAIVARARLARRSRRGACKKCGYDLTGNVSGVCPECGEAATPAPA